ncbi:RNA polymerase sigma factor [Cohnella hashimotonis]|uniref:RNA polymerase sigma factor n=1 Tax=Cohnella hashimotonis TaxID=2826895 RepID=A0ABT6TTP7_9BACL|nr:RNA polymerase sigma factor [Cohnella hashimotonis]MDI4649891.1 RNA polymerase sigma factor [Cohnella hashimotonis]
MNDIASDTEMMRRIAGRDATALEALYDRYEKSVYAFAYRFAQDAMLAEEIVQELFMRIWNQPERYDASLGKLTTWIFAVTRNIAIDQLRKRQNRTTSQTADAEQLARMPDTAGGPEEEYDAKWTGEQLREALSALNPDQQQVLELIYYQGFTQHEVSERHGIPLGTVKSRVRLAMKQLKERLGDLERRRIPYDTTS